MNYGAWLALIAEEEPLRSTAEGRLPLWGSLSLADPYFLVLLPVAVIAFWLGRAQRARARARMSVVTEPLPRTLVQRLAFLPRCFELAALVLAILALARPLRGNVELTTSTEGIDIALLVDRSTSMTDDDLEPGVTRLDVVKEVVGDFARRRMTDREGAADSCGLIAFAKYPEMRCPFTLDVDALLGSLKEIEFADQADGGTGIGVALAKAVAVLSESKAKSRVVVLLTDGENNVDVIMPLEAADLAAEKGIRVYTVLAARRASDRRGFFVMDQEIDTSELEAIAERTGGRFFRARDRAALEATYAAIEELERTQRTEKRWAEQFDLYEKLLFPAFLCWALAWLSTQTWARRLP